MGGVARGIMKGPSRAEIPRRHRAMLLDIGRMRGARDRIDRRYPLTAFESEPDAYRVVEPVELALDVFKDKRRFRLVGRVSTLLELTCSRCLEPFRLPVDAPFDLVFVPAQENAGEGEIEVDEEDLSTAFYRDDVIDLGGMVREQFLLALPMKPLCQQQCRGLCPSCGANRNAGSCSCSQEWTDPRLDALRGLTVGDKRDSHG
jgi:uncharacterized protein